MAGIQGPCNVDSSFLKTHSCLPLSGEFSRAKSSHFNSNPPNLEILVRMNHFQVVEVAHVDLLH